MSQIVLCFIHSYSVLPFYIDVVLTLYINNAMEPWAEHGGTQWSEIDTNQDPISQF